MEKKMENKLLKLNNSDREKVIISKGYKMVEGWSMEFESPEESSNIVISKKEIFKKIAEGFQKYFMLEDGEFFLDLSDAWDEVLDGIYDDLDTDDNNIVYTHIKR